MKGTEAVWVKKIGLSGCGSLIMTNISGYYQMLATKQAGTLYSYFTNLVNIKTSVNLKLFCDFSKRKPMGFSNLNGHGHTSHLG